MTPTTRHRSPLNQGRIQRGDKGSRRLSGTPRFIPLAKMIGGRRPCTMDDDDSFLPGIVAHSLLSVSSEWITSLLHIA